MEQEFEGADAYTAEDFIRVFRPDGHGYISIEDFEGNVIHNVSFDEIVCDLCNDEIMQPDDDPLREVVFLLNGYAVCEECMHDAEDEGEDPSLLHIHQLKGGDE